MYTPNELREIHLDKAVFGGYDMTQVDKLIMTLTEDYTTLFKENAVLKKKLKLLADTVEDYRSVDEAMRKALIKAQNIASEMVSEAEKKSADILANASENAKEKVSELSAQIAAEEKKLEAARAETVEFTSKMKAMLEEERAKFEALGKAVAPTVPQEPTKATADTSDTLDQISKSLEEKVKLEEEELSRKTAEVTASEAEEEKEEASDTITFENENIPTEEEMAELEAQAEKPKRARRPQFENLKFGTDYDIKSDN